MRDPKTLRVFAEADALVPYVYEWTTHLPADERYGLTSQIRRSAVSVPSNLVEGCSRESEADFRRFVEIALGSAMELRYQLRLAANLFPEAAKHPVPVEEASVVVQSLVAFMKALRA